MRRRKQGGMTMVVIGKSTRVQVVGPLENCVAGFETELSRLGFAPTSATIQMGLMAHLSRWLQAHQLVVADLTVEHVEAFLRERRSSYTALVSHRALRPLLNWLAAVGMITPQTAAPRQVQDP